GAGWGRQAEGCDTLFWRLRRSCQRLHGSFLLTDLIQVTSHGAASEVRLWWIVGAVPPAPLKPVAVEFQPVGIETCIATPAGNRIDADLDIDPPGPMIHSFHAPDRVEVS